MAKRSRKEREPSLGDLLGLNVGQAGSVASAFMSGLETFAGPQKRLLDQLGQFAAHFSRAALERWPGNAPGARCVMQDCGGDAVLACMACGQPVCLAHAHVSHRAEGVCDQCVADMLATRGRQYRPPSGRQPDAKEIRKALHILGLSGEPSWAEIQRAHRKLAAESHPDRARTAATRRRAEDKTKKINAAFETLRRHYERSAA